VTVVRSNRYALAAAAGLAAVSALHAAWATGSCWPAVDRRSLADTVAGARDMPGPAACLAVSAALAAAAAVTAGVGGEQPLAVTARAAVAVTLSARAATGLTGGTHLLVPWTPSARFVDLDRRLYGPCCGLLAALVAAGLRERRLAPAEGPR